MRNVGTATARGKRCTEPLSAPQRALTATGGKRAGGTSLEWRVAHEPLRLSPFVLEEQDALKFREPVRAIIKRTEDCFPVGDRERDGAALVGVGVFEGFSRGR